MKMEMNKSLLAAAGLAMTMASPLAVAGGILFNPMGLGPGAGCCVFLTGLGNSTGDALLQGLAGTNTNAGTVYLNNNIDLSGYPTVLGELTFVLGRSTMAAPLVVNAEGLNPIGPPAGGAVNYFSVYWDPPGGGAANHPNHITGNGYDNATGGILLIQGTVTYDPSQFAFISSFPSPPDTPVACPLTGTCLSLPGTLAAVNATSATPTTGLFGTAVFDVNFTPGTQNMSYVVNNLTSATVDWITTNTLNAPYNPAFLAKSYAPTQVGGTLAGHGDTLLGGPGVGADGINNLNCLLPPFPPVQSGQCNVMVQANTTLEVFSAPEPTTLALMGLGLGLAGWRARRRAGLSATA